MATAAARHTDLAAGLAALAAEEAEDALHDGPELRLPVCGRWVALPSGERAQVESTYGTGPDMELVVRTERGRVHGDLDLRDVTLLPA